MTTVSEPAGKPDATITSILEYAEQHIEGLRVRQQERRAAIPADTLTWLAVSPPWSIDLAQACEFPAGPAGVSDTLHEAALEGLCAEEQGQSELKEDDGMLVPSVTPARYSMSPVQRQRVISETTADPSRGREYLRQQLLLAGNRVTQALAGDPAAGLAVKEYQEMERWAALASRASSEIDVATTFRSAVGGCLSAEPARLGEVLRWIDIARLLEPIFPGPLMSAAEWAGRQLAVCQRRRDDERHLQGSLLRQEYIDAFLDLIGDEHPDWWALHFVGDGGVGKTTILRWIGARWSAKATASIARIDFDYLNPDYPARSPALLLAEFARDLMLYDKSGVATSNFVAFRERADALNERLRLESGAALTAVAATQDPEFDGMFDIFVAAVKALPPGPVVLVLDTCEELAKLRADGQVPESVQATFHLLERLHTEVPSIRAVFAGRRPLASSGAGWKAQGSELPGRPYLRLAEVQGFSRAQAETFLADRKVPARLVDAVLRQSSAPEGDSGRFAWDTPEPGRAAGGHYLPFDLAMYADLVLYRPDITAEAIEASDTDQYIQSRIVERISEPLEGLLPGIVQLGRVDRNTFQGIAELAPEQFQAVFGELRAQEWIDVQPSGSLEIDRRLLPRLRAYYRRREPAVAERWSTRVASYLMEATQRQSLAELDIAHFDAVFRLETDLHALARWWDRIDARFVAESAFGWALELTSGLLGADGALCEHLRPEAAAGSEHPLRAAVLATRAAAELHSLTQPDLLRLWSEVQNKAAAHPTADGQRRLRQRAEAGFLAASINPADPPDEAEWSQLQDCVASAWSAGFDEQLAAGCVAAAEALVERGEGRPDRHFGTGVTAVARHAVGELASRLAGGEGPPELTAFARILEARAVALDAGSGAGANDELGLVRGAIRMLPEPGLTPPRWLDWSAPAETWARVRVEAVRVLWPARLGPEGMLRELGTSLATLRFPPVASIDSARLASAMVELVAAERPLSPSELDGLEQSGRGLTPRRSTCNAHRRFAPLFATLALANADSGSVASMLDSIADFRRQAEESGDALETARHAQRAELTITRRMRLRDEGQGLAVDLTLSPDLADWELIWALDGLDGARQVAKAKRSRTFDLPVEVPESDRLPWYHARWRARYGLTHAETVDAVRWARSTLRQPSSEDASEYDRHSTRLDAIEAIHLGEVTRFSPPAFRQPEVQSELREAARWSGRDTAGVEEALVVSLRAAALGVPDWDTVPVAGRDRMLAALGTRRAAEIAMDEGELLALRHSVPAAGLLRQASTWFGVAGDGAGALRASIAEATCWADTPRPGELQEALLEAHTHYAGARSQARERLPDWEELESIARQPEQVALDQLQPVEWRPWLVRLIAAMAKAEEVDLRSAGAPLVDWVARTYGRQANVDGASRGVQLPPELTWCSPAPGRRGRWRAISEGVGVMVATLLAALLAFVLIVGAGIYGFYYAVVGTAWFLLLRKALPRTGFWIKIEPKSGESGDPRLRSARVRWHRSLPRWLNWVWGVALNSVAGTAWLYRLRWKRSGQVVGVPRQRVPYQEVAKAFRGKLRREFTTMRRLLGRRSMAVELDVDPTLAGVPWETLILRTRKQLSVSEFCFRFHRTMANVPVRRQFTAAHLSHVTVCAVGDPPSSTFNGWRALSPTVTPAMDVSSRDDLRVAGCGPETGVLHLVGAMLETASGVRLQLNSLSTRAKASRVTQHFERGELLRANDIAEMFHILGFCILQAPPMLISERTTADRLQAANLRQFASELFLAGIPGVLTVPPLPLDTATGVVRLLADEVARSNDFNLDRVVSACQGAVGECTQLDAGDQLEAALDFCLYIAPDTFGSGAGILHEG